MLYIKMVEQLNGIMKRIADLQANTVNGHIGHDFSILHNGIRLIAVRPESVLIPAFKIQPKGLPRQSVEAGPQSRCLPIILDDLHLLTRLPVDDRIRLLRL